MCGRYTLAASAGELAAEFGADVPDGYQPHFNIAPQQDVRVLGRDREGARRMAFLRWGLVPPWATAEGARAGPINARAESIAVRPTFRDAFRHRRCLIIADGFYEWKREGRTKVPFRLHLSDGGLLAFAGLWETWNGGPQPLHTCAIVTTDASPLVAPIHDRMPVILGPGDRERWIDPATAPSELQALLRPSADPRLEAYEVSRVVNAVANDSPECIRPA
jgi:putative SOS response-associated peptidase YedK